MATGSPARFFPAILSCWPVIETPLLNHSRMVATGLPLTRLPNRTG